ncbi:MAG: hypothetical protein LJE67_03440 [Salaquimonas sp.]|nr:hypothetical protein [Salaquimonas sp.]
MAKDLAVSRTSVTRPIIQAAHFDVAIVSAGGACKNSGNPGDAVNHLVNGLKSASKHIALFDCASGGGHAAHYPYAHHVLAHSGKIRLDRMACVASKLHCLDDRLFDLDGGAEYVKTYASTARRAGRITGLLCTNLSTVFSNRQEIFDSFIGSPDFVVGEPVAVLSLFSLKRIDTLIPRLIHRGEGLALHRVDHPSIFVRPGNNDVETDNDPISREEFWSQFVPSALEAFLDPMRPEGNPVHGLNHRQPAASSGRPRGSQPSVAVTACADARTPG